MTNFNQFGFNDSGSNPTNFPGSNPIQNSFSFVPFRPIYSTSLIEVAEHGRLYKPATSHYPTKPNITVKCDHCDRENLVACIGYNDRDLCLTCADDIMEKYLKTKIQPPVQLPNPLIDPVFFPRKPFDPFEPRRPFEPRNPFDDYTFPRFLDQNPKF
jgi:hypothetical protein